MFDFLCYKFTLEISQIDILLDFENNSRGITKNKYFTYTIKEIKSDLESLKLSYLESSNISVEYSNKLSTYNKDHIKHFDILLYLVLTVESLEEFRVISYNEEIYMKLLYYNDYKFFSNTTFNLNDLENFISDGEKFLKRFKQLLIIV